MITNAAQSVPEGQFTGATLTVSVDNESVATLPIQVGSNVSYDNPTPGTALDDPLSDGRHELVLFLDAGNDCTDPSRQTSVVISGASFFTLPYTETEPAIDLTTLPRPIFQRDSIFPVNVVTVVPDAPTAGELQAGLTAVAAFGRMSIRVRSGLRQGEGVDDAWKGRHRFQPEQPVLRRSVARPLPRLTGEPSIVPPIKG